MSILLIILLAAAAVSFLLAVFGVTSRVDLVALGLLLWVAAYIIQTITH